MPNSADDVRREAREALVRDTYADPVFRYCQACDRLFTLDAVVSEDGVRIEAYTGRLYCFHPCWLRYLRGENEDSPRTTEPTP